MTAADRSPARTSLSAGLRGRCPRCGKGSLFEGYLKVAPVCGHCGLGLVGHDSGDGPAVAATFILGTVVVALAAAVELLFHPPLWLHALLWAPTVIGGTLALLPPLKGLTIAIQYRTRAVDEPEKLGGL